MAGNMTYDPNCLPDLLPIYYKRLFPYSLYYRWLHYGGVPKTYFNHREFSFTLKDDVYLRYQSFSDQQEMEKEIQKKCPYKIDIGAVFSHRPKDHKTVKAAAFQALEKELVFDIDMTDYDDVRSCCSGAEICLKCWTLMQIAIKILDRALREDFGFHHILWVYSGRRGVHCWVCDPDARKRLQQKGRTAVAEYLSVIRGGENMTKKVNLREGSIHPSIQKAIEIVRDSFEEYAIGQQDFLGSDSKVKKVLDLIPDDLKAVRSMVENDFRNAKTSADRWQVLQDRITQVKSKGEGRKCACVVEEIMLQYCYPRLDINVSKGLNHLLKSPFCVHPKTGRVCVPINHERVDEFNPLTVPTISQLCDELDQTETSSDRTQKIKIKDMKQTSLKNCLVVFENFLKNLEGTWRGKLIEQSDMEGTF